MRNLKLDRARDHYTELEKAVRAFLTDKPYEAELVSGSYVVSKSSQPPPEIALIAGDCIHCIRCSLDHLIHSLIQVGTGEAGPFSWAQFPICKDEGTYLANRDACTKGMDCEAIKQLNRLKPYKGGMDVFWSLHRLDITDKHRDLLVVGSAVTKVDITTAIISKATHEGHQHIISSVRETGVPWVYEMGEPIEARLGQTIYTPKSDLHYPVELSFEFELCLAEPEAPRGQSLLRVLKGFLDCAHVTQESFDRHCV